MATEAKTVRGHNPAARLLRAPAQLTQAQRSVQSHAPGSFANGAHDLTLFHNSTDTSWTAKLADRLRGARFGKLNLRLSIVDWSSATGADALTELRKCLRGHGFLAIVLSRAMVRQDWTGAQRAIELLKEVAPAEGRVITILKDNVTIPPLFRLSEWFDFRDESHFEESVSDLLSFLSEDCAPSGQVYSFGVSSAKERILSNLFPVVELPKFVNSAETPYETEVELTEACAGAGPLPFILKGSRLYTVVPLAGDSVFAHAVNRGDAPRQEDFTQWFSRQDRAGWAIELLNSLFRQHAWKRGLRWDKSTDQFYFPRTKPKSVWWEIGGQTISREVTAPHVGWIELENSEMAEVQYGWRHQSIRADFVQVMGNLYFRLQPSWLLTKLDSKTPQTTRPVTPISSGQIPQERNGQALRSLRFWSAVLARGHHEIRMTTGQAPVRARLTPLSGFTQFGIPSDRMNYDLMMLTEREDDLLIPALGPLEQESLFNDEEGVSSTTVGSSRNKQPQART